MTIDVDQLAALNATRDLHHQPRYARPVALGHAALQAVERPHLYGGYDVMSGVLDRRLSHTGRVNEPVN